MTSLNREHTLALVACFRNENAYLREWLEYHRLIGVGHVFLYDNDGSAEASAIVEPFVRDGFVTRHAWQPSDSRWRGTQQHQAYAHCAQHHRDECRFLLKLDIDEFLAPVGCDHVNEALAAYDAAAIRGIRLPRYDFGDSGHLQRPDGLVIAAYLRREARASHHKDIASTQHLWPAHQPRSSHYWRHHPRSWLKRWVRASAVETLRIHHYYTKSLAEYLVRQNPTGGRAQTRAAFVARNACCHAVHDDSLQRFARQLTAAVQA